MSVCVYLMLSTVSSGMGATVCTAGRFLLVAPFTKLDEEEDEEEAESVAPVRHNGRNGLSTGKADYPKEKKGCLKSYKGCLNV